MTPSRHKSWPLVEARLARETHPRRRRNLETLLRHLRAESEGDLEGVMKSLAPQPSFRAHPSDDPYLNPMGFNGVRAFYAAWIAAGGELVDYDIQRLIVDDDALVTEGPLQMPFAGSVLLSLGYEVDDEDAFYQYQARLAVIWHLDAEGRIQSEILHTAGDGYRGIGDRKLAPEDLDRS